MTVEESLLTAEEGIKPYLARFKGCYEKAIRQYLHLLNAYRKPMYNRTKAINFQNIIVNEIKDEFEGTNGVTIIEKYESISLVLDNHISARFKKLNAKGLPSNRQSNRNDAIISQQLTLGYEDYPPIAWVDVGYTLDATGTQYELLKVVCRKKDNILWDLYFHDIDTGNASNDISVTIQPTPPDNGPNTPRVTIKKKEEKKKAE